MHISVIGSGRVATHLAKQLAQLGLNIQQIYSRNLHQAEKLASQVQAQAIDQFAQLQPVDLLILAVSDQAIAEVVQQVHPYVPNSLIVHTSGSTALTVLSQYHTRCGVLYPLQTFSLQREIDWKNTPLFVEAQAEADLALLQQLTEKISARVYLYDSAQRLSLHLAAVFACNFSNYCYDVAKQILDEQHVDFALLAPLILETAEKALQNEPKKMQTGPAMRQDVNILAMHRQMLEQHRDWQQMYQCLSDGIMQRHHISSIDQSGDV